MATYTFRAVDQDANILSGQFQAQDETDLERKLNMQGLTLIEAVKAGFFTAEKGGRVRFTLQNLVDFSYFLRLIISSGMPITGGLGDLMKNQENRRLAEAATLIHDKLEAGMSLSDAMQEHPALFPDYYTQMIAAGEASGSLEKVLKDLMSYIEWQINFRKTVRSALIYPVMVLSAVILLIGVLFTFVFPRLVGILVGLRVELPLATRIVITTANFVNHYFPLIVLSAAAAFVLFKLWLRTYEGRRKFDTFLLALPLVGTLIRKINLSRYCKTLATLHGAGLNIKKTFTIASAVVQNTVLSEAMAQVTESIMNGKSIAQSMQETGAFPSLVVDLVSIGEKSGNLESAVQRASDMFDKEVPETLKKVFSLFEPLIIVLLGALVLVVLLSIFLPIYKVVGGIRVR
ncbi:MAG TPA: type II secretion system F family protein [Nitrospirota bacterium]|nr:type II secretion system F family protein [Nitrospirota bacterium]